MFTIPLLTFVVAVAEPAWHQDYSEACRQAIQEKKDLLIHFYEDDRLDKVLEHSEIKQRLANFALLQVHSSYKYDGKRLLDYPALREMMGKHGLAIICYSNPKHPEYARPISVHPHVSSRYHWVPSYGVNELKVILDLPKTATLTQRSMIYAVSVHPERPQSIYGTAHPAFLRHAERHSQRQAAMMRQHHADIISASNHIQAEAGIGFGGASEVVAESWGNVVGGENVLEACFSCVDAWRQSSGHWSAVSRPHRYFGYDIARGANNTWYATGFFAD